MTVSWQDLLDTVRELGVPALIGVLLGALVADWLARRRDKEAHKRAVELMRKSDERQAAKDALRGAREIRLIANHSGEQTDWGPLHNQWTDTVADPARLVASNDLDRRAQSGAYVLMLAVFAPSDQAVSYAVIRGALDVEEWAEAFLRGDDSLPDAHLPPREEIQKLTKMGRIKGGVTFDALNLTLSHLESERVNTSS